MGCMEVLESPRQQASAPRQAVQPVHCRVRRRVSAGPLPDWVPVVVVVVVVVAAAAVTAAVVVVVAVAAAEAEAEAEAEASNLPGRWFPTNKLPLRQNPLATQKLLPTRNPITRTR